MNPADSVRIDVWLWRARFFKTRGLSGALANKGRIRIGQGEALRKITKPSALVRKGDRLTFPVGKQIVSLEILELGLRRGPASEARQLYRMVENED